ncbi:MAG: OB-fold nucleic acid binding domain-containing protein [Halobacteria archaeon]|nr:OB-fold nucleic acid binding domain-containing protein [Halobacteria archaeon]
MDSQDDGDDIARTYADLDTDIPEDEFRERVEAKVEQMGGLCDEATAAKLVAHELSQDKVYDIAEIKPDHNEVKFQGKVTKIEETRTFERDDGDEGKVANIEVGDETGRIRVALWDEYADSVDELEVGQVLKIAGKPRQGYNSGVEISAKQIETADDIEVEVLDGSISIKDIESGMSNISIKGHVLDVSGVRKFGRDDGSEGQVSNLIVGDDTDWIRVTCWDDLATEATQYQKGDSVRISDGYAKKRDGNLEVHVGNRGTLEMIDEEVEFNPETTPIGELEVDSTYDVEGVVTDGGTKRTFTRDDGDEGQVKNIRIRDDTGELRVALWGEHAENNFLPGDKVQLTNVQIKEGWNDGLEGSLNWTSTINVVESGGIPEEDLEESDNETKSKGLDSFT